MSLRPNIQKQLQDQYLLRGTHVPKYTEQMFSLVSQDEDFFQGELSCFSLSPAINHRIMPYAKMSKVFVGLWPASTVSGAWTGHGSLRALTGVNIR